MACRLCVVGDCQNLGEHPRRTFLCTLSCSFEDRARYFWQERGIAALGWDEILGETPSIALSWGKVGGRYLLRCENRALLTSAFTKLRSMHFSRRDLEPERTYDDKKTHVGRGSGSGLFWAMARERRRSYSPRRDRFVRLL